ncbi:hypothetical protein BGZ83_006798 [Gryganskiella cystojenkinii]|nr:hypothetical protein BGZ83_006798 [Gryganskiella cystojenkinii]
MFSATARTIARSGRTLWTVRQSAVKATKSYRPAVLVDQRCSRACYSTTQTLFKQRRDDDGLQHVNIKNSNNKDQFPKSATTPLSATALQTNDDALLSDTDDLMIGNEGVESIDPKDFPELYPGDEEIEGLSQESHPDNERDFEEIDIKATAPKSTSVLLSDKERSEEEFSWFVDESFPETAAADSEGGVSTTDFIPLWQKNAERAPDGTDSKKSEEDEVSPDSIPGLVKLLESERARNIKVIDMRDKCDWTNWMVIAEGLSERHLGNVADQVYSALKKSSPKTSPPVMEGRDTSDWVVIDAGSVVIHFMTPEARKERDLEGLWASVRNPLKLKDAEDISWEDVKGKMTKSWKENPGRSKGEDGKRGRRGERDIPLSEVVKW